MDNTNYNMIFKRKSFHLFRNIGQEPLSSSELENIQKMYDTFTPLYPDIKTAIRIVPAEETSCRRGQEYCNNLQRTPLHDSDCHFKSRFC